jgi:hypothetical protein
MDVRAMRWKVVGVFVLGAIVGVGAAFWRFETVTAPCVEAAEIGLRVWSPLKDIRHQVVDGQRWLKEGAVVLDAVVRPRRYRDAGFNLDSLPLRPQMVSGALKPSRMLLKEQYQVGVRSDLAETAAACRESAG